MVWHNKIPVILSLVLVLIIVFSLFPSALVFAHNDDDDDSGSSNTSNSVSVEGIGGVLISSPTDNVGGSDIKAAIGFVNKKMAANGTLEENTIYVKHNGANMKVAYYDDSNKKFVIGKNFEKLTANEQSKVLNYFVDNLSKSESDKDAMNNFLTNLSEGDTDISAILLAAIFASTKGDLWRAWEIMRPTMNIISTILGIAAVILIFILLCSTVLDLAYIGLPIWREKIEKEGDKKMPFGVSWEAQSVVKEVEQSVGESYKNGYLLYLKRRALSYILLSICIMYLITGGLSGIISFLLQMVSGITG